MSTQLPFYSIFDALRRNGFPLGIDEYKDFIEVLCGYGVYAPTESILSRNELLDICKTLWLKPNQVPFIFEKIFDEHYNRIFHHAEKVPAREGGNAAHTHPDRQQMPSAETRKPEAITPEPSIPDIASQDQKTEAPAAAEMVRFRLMLDGGQGRQQHFHKEEKPAESRLFLFSDNYFPVTCREVQQLFGSLPERRNRKARIEIDTDSTIQSIARNGYLAKIIYKKEEDIVNHLLILHDHKGSMVAFEELSALITEAGNALFRKGRQREVMASTFYFQNIADDIIYRNKAHTRYLKMGEFIDLFREKKVMIIIVSDAGAARMSNSTVRVKGSIRMLRQLAQVSSKVVWLNPMPPERWERSAAARIANFVPMFTIDRNGIQHAVEVLKGKQLKTNE